MGKSRYLSGWQWVRQAASTDEARPILTGIYLATTEGGYTLAATDGHRLHVAPMEAAGLQLPTGTYRVDEYGVIDGQYPNYVQVMKPKDEVQARGWVVEDPLRLLKVCEGGAAFNAAYGTQGVWMGAPCWVKSDGGTPVVAAIDPAYLRDALRGLQLPLAPKAKAHVRRLEVPKVKVDHSLYLYAPGPLDPLNLYQAGTERQATIMPVRVMREEALLVHLHRYLSTETKEQPPAAVPTKEAASV